VVLVLVSFLLTILGTFLTRSGVVNSVHSFTQSPIGPTFLVFLAICMIAVVVILTLRIDTLASEPGKETLAAREGAFLVNNLFFVAFMFTVLVGTLFPIAAEAVRGVKVSVGEPYFNRMSVPIGFGLLLLLGIGPALPWGRADGAKVRRALLWPLPAAAVGLALTWALGGRTWSVLLTGALAGFALWVTFDQGLRPTRARMKKGESAPQALGASFRRAPRLVGAYLVHFGVIVTFVAIAISSNYQTSAEGNLQEGAGTIDISGYELSVSEIAVAEEDHRAVQMARVNVSRDGRELGTLAPSLNHYPTDRQPIGTPAVRTTLTHDLYLTLMNVHGNGTVGLRAIVTPAVVWIWIGVFIMTLGTGLCLLSPLPVRVAVKKEVPALDEGVETA
jgi:cytochrome c-type biogenesis protein CcmF